MDLGAKIPKGAILTGNHTFFFKLVITINTKKYLFQALPAQVKRY